ncbi:MAG: uracil-DNA glycosylase [Planctomycetales bacterium]|nr:uracil-DNA glycosylase [Planctomycetales bacterium]
MDSTTLRIALRQQLESLVRSGVQQGPRIDPALWQTLVDKENVVTTAVPPKSVPAAEAPRPTVRKPTDTAPAVPVSASATATSSGVATGQVQANLSALAHDSWQTSSVDRESRIRLLAEIDQEVKACEKCPILSSNRTQTVFGVGNVMPRLCFFGEGPGADEDKQGEPFVGAAGQLLNKIIQACTMQREDVYILNVVKCRPPGNRNPAPDEVSHCRPFFERQLEVLQPEFICCLGGVATSALLETKLSVGRLRGKLHDYKGAKVMVTYHPAYLLRNPSSKKYVWEDMQKLMKAMGIQLPGKDSPQS